MSIEDRLRSAFTQRADGVEVSPGALFEIQRRIGHRRRLPEVRLRPALVLAAAACAAIAVVISVSVTGPTAAPPISTETAPVAATPDPAAVAPTTVDPPPTPQSPTPAPPAVAQVEPPPDDTGQITTTPTSPAPIPPTPPAPPEPPAPVTPTPPPDPTPPSDTDPESETVTAEAIECPAEPAAAADDSSTSVTVYFACGENDSAPRLRSAATNSLPTALGILLGGPNDADRAAGFTGLSGNSATTVTTMTDNRWLTIDFPAGLAGAFDTDGSEITAGQFLTQLNATVFQFADFDVAEYRLDGDCAAFGDIVGRSCGIHIREGDGYAGHTSELTAHTIGDVDSVIRAEPNDSATQLGILLDGSRLTDGRSGSNAWAEIVTTGGDRGWVSAETIVAQPLSIDSATSATLSSLARRLTTGPGLEPSAFVPAGLVLRWGADDADLAVVATSGPGVGSDWWNTPLGTPSPRDGSAESSLADLLWIDGNSDGATVTVNAPGPLGEPHGDFASLAYVSIYRPAIASSILPPELAPTATTTTTQASTGEESDLPPALPTPEEETDDAGEQPDPPRAQVSVIFDFLSADGPRVAAVEAIWIQP
ncbi:MAG: SH3 domain-containing protein [bacterium]|nr:SH3 domain-containing protein [bacterium]